jgi:putative spermidine/putrescine transport system ATP-binding protein
MKLQLEGVTKRYSDVTAVEKVSFGVSEGEFLTLLGPSGSGKTTTLMLIAGFIAPDEGRVYLNRRDVTNLPEFKRNIGVVFQNYALFPHMNVYGNIAFPLRMRRVPRTEIDQRVKAALETVGLRGYGNRYPRQLSGGQQQRVALARALVFDPPLLLMDEPLGSLDRKLREQMQVEFKRIQRELKVTVVYVTHDQEEALAMSDRVALMHDGQLEQIGTANELYERPVSRFVAEFIGEANCLDGVVVACGLKTTIDVGRGCTVEGAASNLAVGSPVTAVVRPERISIAYAEDRSVNEFARLTGENEFSGVIVEQIYTGATMKYTVALDGGGRNLLVRHVSRLNGNERQLERGDRVFLRWGFDDTIVTAASRQGS